MWSLAFLKPPLGYFLAVIASKKWDYLSVLTSGPDEQLNPTYRVMGALNSQGFLGTNVAMHKVGGCGAMLLGNIQYVRFGSSKTKQWFQQGGTKKHF